MLKNASWAVVEKAVAVASNLYFSGEIGVKLKNALNTKNIAIKKSTAGCHISPSSGIV